MGKKKKTHYSGIGGQAVLEGIMMRNDNKFSVVVRKSDGVLETVVKDVEVNPDKVIKKIPFIRGVFAFVESLRLGFDTLEYSATFYGTDTSEPTWFDKLLNKLFGKHTDVIVAAFTMAFSLILCLAVFVALPYFLSYLLKDYIVNQSVLTIIEGGIRIIIFVLYALAISFIKDTRRTFKYHGAEHKCINCIEHGKKLNVTNVRNASRLHGRCGTNFLFIVAALTVVLFVFIRVDSAPLRLLFRIALIPVIAGVSYEILRIIGKYNNAFTRILSLPGKALQFITTKEPDDEMITVAITAVEAVFDWKQFLLDNFPEDYIPEDFGMERKDYVKVVGKKEKNLNGKVRKNKDVVKDVINPENFTQKGESEEIPVTKTEEVVEESIFVPDATADVVEEDERGKNRRKKKKNKKDRREEIKPELQEENAFDVEDANTVEEKESKENVEDIFDSDEESTSKQVDAVFSENEDFVFAEELTYDEKNDSDDYEEISEPSEELGEDINEYASEEEINPEEEYSEEEYSEEEYLKEDALSDNYEEEDLTEYSQEYMSEEYEEEDSNENYEEASDFDDAEYPDSGEELVSSETENDFNESLNEEPAEYVKPSEKLTKTQPIVLDLMSDYGFDPDDEEVPEDELKFEPVDESATGEIDLSGYEEEIEEEEEYDGPLFSKDITSIPMPDKFNIVEFIPEGGMGARIYNVEEETSPEDDLLGDEDDFENIFDEHGRFAVKDTEAFSRKLDEEFDEIMKSLGLDDDI